MADSAQHRELLYQYEVLRSRLAIREHYLNTIIKEVYDNIGQMLSLTRIQLSLLRSDDEKRLNEKINSSGELVGKTIRDLRSMCQLLFNPESEINNGIGFNRAVEQEIKDHCPGAVCSINEEISRSYTIANEKGLVLFGILLEILTLIKDQRKGQVNSANIKWNKSKLTVSIMYNCEVILGKKIKQELPGLNLSLVERMNLMNGYIQIKNVEPAYTAMKLTIPIN